MLNADDLRRCECCEEPTKKVVGFWEGHDSYSGSPRAGAIYSCEDHECDICKEKMSEKESDELLKERVKVANLQNGTDAELLRRSRMSVRVALGAAADIIGVSAAEYSAEENGRMPITREEYHNILMPLFEAIKAIPEGKRCGQCRYYRESGYFSTQGSCYWKSGATEVGVSKKACVRWKPRVDSAFRFSKDERKPVVIEQIRNCGKCGHDFNAIRECRFSSGACLNISGSVTEYCSNCENEVTMNWDVNKQGYQAFCPVCGKRLMLCSECLDAEDNTARGMCDYDSDTDSCFRRKGDRE